MLITIHTCKLVLLCEHLRFFSSQLGSTALNVTQASMFWNWAEHVKAPNAANVEHVADNALPK